MKLFGSAHNDKNIYLKFMIKNNHKKSSYTIIISHRHIHMYIRIYVHMYIYNTYSFM